jgi:hypothetical protein
MRPDGSALGGEILAARARSPIHFLLIPWCVCSILLSDFPALGFASPFLADLEREQSAWSNASKAELQGQLDLARIQNRSGGSVQRIGRPLLEELSRTRTAECRRIGGAKI